jgi:hypothetical protein
MPYRKSDINMGVFAPSPFDACQVNQPTTLCSRELFGFFGAYRAFDAQILETNSLED